MSATTFLDRWRKITIHQSLIDYIQIHSSNILNEEESKVLPQSIDFTAANINL